MLGIEGEAMDKAVAILKTIETPYPEQISRFCSYLEEHGVNQESISQYLETLQGMKRIDRKGNQVSYSPSWYNQHLKAVKQAVRYLLDHSTLTNGQSYAVEKYLKTKKLKTVKAGISKADRVPTREELEILIHEADPRLSLMIRFLMETSCRISEMLEAESGKARRGQRITYIEVAGKGDRTRDLKCSTALYDEIRKEFNGRLLFEHGGKPYSRVATTIRIKQLAERVIGKPVTAHMIRHFRGTSLSQSFGISKASAELGHASIATTKQFYDHSELDESEYLKSINS